ncbi:MAG TPA: hypothetical protein VFE27_18015 [Acidobacteriaceae bacterium]|jgi:hypothetical protein|nr:hypothetical protein [Acidobacteriaceae bacterium]
MKLRIGIELLIGQIRQISMGRLADLFLQESYIGDDRAFLKGPVGVPYPLERVNPKPFAVENMNRLFTQRAEAEAGYFPHIIVRGNCGEMIQNQIEAGVCPAMEFPNTVDGEH